MIIKTILYVFQQFPFVQDFNNFPEDMRNDDEAKAELHQRVDVRNL